MFVNPVNVSKGYEPDMVLLALDLSELETVQGGRLPSKIYNYRQIPTQMLTETEAEEVEDAGTASEDIFVGAMSARFFFSLIFSAYMGDLWSILNSLQVTQLVSLFNVRTPGNLNAFNTYMERVSSIKVFDFDTFILQNIYTPEMIPESLNFQNAGYDTTLFLITARSCIINIITLILLGVVNLLLASVRKCIPHKYLT